MILIYLIFNFFLLYFFKKKIKNLFFNCSVHKNEKKSKRSIFFFEKEKKKNLRRWQFISPLKYCLYYNDLTFFRYIFTKLC